LTARVACSGHAGVATSAGALPVELRKLGGPLQFGGAVPCDPGGVLGDNVGSHFTIPCRGGVVRYSVVNRRGHTR